MKKFYFKIEQKQGGSITNLKMVVDNNLKYIINDKPLSPGEKGKGEFIVLIENNEDLAIKRINEIKKGTLFILSHHIVEQDPTGEKPKKCKEKKCTGLIDQSVSVSLQTGCSSFSSAYACEKCGRLHWLNYYTKRVSGVRNRQGEKAFLQN